MRRLRHYIGVALYLISYDIAKDDSFEYDRLWDRLRKLGAVRILYSEWMIKGGPEQAATIYDELAPTTQKKDRLLVIEVTKDAFSDKLMIDDSMFQKILGDARD